MSYKVIARKWRPQQFSDVVGQAHVVRTLTNAIESERVAHAYLFVGPRGTGKTTSARILAKALNCTKGPTPTPCDACDSCREIVTGNNMDVLEIDGASNNGVEQVRDLRQNVQYAPVRGPYKIYIIDEVHMLSTAAFNALLKTLEEPPAHVKFFFATTEPQKVPATILSRCQRFDLRKISIGELVGRLEFIAKAEGVEIDEDAMLAIARGADGGMRDAQSALDQLVSFRGKQITEDDVLSVFGLVSRKLLEELALAVLGGEVPAILDLVSQMDDAGKDMQRVVVELLDQFRNILLVLNQAKLDLPQVQVERLKELTAQTDAERVLRIVQVLMETEGKLRYALSRRTLLETALVRCAQAARIASLDEIMGDLQQLRSYVEGSAASAPNISVPNQANQPSVAAPANQASVEAPTKSVATGAPERSVVPKSEPQVAPVAASADSCAYLQEHWHDFVVKVGKRAPLAKSYLMDAKPVSVDDTKLVIGFDPEYGEHVTKINYPRNVKSIQKELESLIGKSLPVEFVLLSAEDGKHLPTDHIPEKTAGEGNPEGASGRNTKTKQEWMQDPAVQKTLEMFNGDIADIRE